MVYPDFDMFGSHNPNARFHGIARTLNCGPIYLTGDVGLLGIWNAADTENVTGQFSPSDVPGLSGNEYLVFEYFSQQCHGSDRIDW